MRIEKDDYGMTRHVSASLLMRLREIDRHYSLRAYDHSTINRAREFIYAVWQMHLKGEVDRDAIAKLLTDAKLV